MQLNLAFPDLPDPASPPPTPWDQLDEEARTAALEILARLIARLLVADTRQETSDE